MSILSQLRIKTRLSTICQQRILSYFGHTVRRGDESLEKLIVVGNTEGKRSRGRSPTRWTDQVKDSSSSKFYAVVRDALDRDRWRQIIRSRCNSDANHDPRIWGTDYRERENYWSDFSHTIFLWLYKLPLFNILRMWMFL